MKILITTPNGCVGRKIVPELLAPEFSVRVITRNLGGLPRDIREQVEIVRGSTDDASTLREALEGVDAMFWCIPRRAAIRHLRCGRFTENPYIPISTTAAADIADVALRLLVRTDWNGIESLSLRGLADPEHDQLFETLLT